MSKAGFAFSFPQFDKTRSPNSVCGDGGEEAYLLRREYDYIFDTNNIYLKVYNIFYKYLQHLYSCVHLPTRLVSYICRFA